MFTGALDGDELQGVVSDTSQISENAMPAIALDFAFEKPDIQLGAKVGWSSQVRGVRYGLHSSWKGIYGAANYAPGDKSWLFEAGVLLPLGKRK